MGSIIYSKTLHDANVNYHAGNKEFGHNVVTTLLHLFTSMNVSPFGQLTWRIKCHMPERGPCTELIHCIDKFSRVMFIIVLAYNIPIGPVVLE